jgi:hypothetical protein
MTRKSKKPITYEPLKSGSILHRVAEEIANAVAQRLKGKESMTAPDEKMDASRASPTVRN